MSRIAVTTNDMFEDSKYTEPVKARREVEHSLTHGGLTVGDTVHGKKNNTPVAIDSAVKDASVDDFYALLIPGGYFTRPVADR